MLFLFLMVTPKLANDGSCENEAVLYCTGHTFEILQFHYYKIIYYSKIDSIVWNKRFPAFLGTYLFKRIISQV